MKYFISQPMNGLSDEEILEVRNRIIDTISAMDENAIILDSIVTDEAPLESFQALWYLSQAIAILAEADTIYLARGWENSRGCKIEHECAEKYGIIIIEEV